MPRLSSISSVVAATASRCLVFGCAAPAAAQTPDPWPGLARDIFQDRDHEPGGECDLAAVAGAGQRRGDRADDHHAREARDQIRKATLVIDQNPAPMAAQFHHRRQFRPDDDFDARARQRLHQRACRRRDERWRAAVIERFVKAAGGCSAPSVKSLDEADSNLGQMKFATYSPPISAMRSGARRR